MILLEAVWIIDLEKKLFIGKNTNQETFIVKDCAVPFGENSEDDCEEPAEDKEKKIP